MAEALTQQQRDELAALLNSGNRTGYYIRYYEFTGSVEAITQAEISSFSGLLGGAAIVGNALAKALDNTLGQQLWGQYINLILTDAG